MTDTIIVTGGLGYIGAHMAKLLHQKGYEVIVIDNNWHGHPNVLTGIKIYQEDIRNEQALEAIFSKHQVHAVMHFASFIQVGESVKEPEKYFDNNVEGTRMLWKIMAKHHVPYGIASSTAAIFGEPEYTPIDEQHPKCPINPYGESKLRMEAVLEEYEQSHNVISGALRYFNAAGCSEEGDIGELHDPETHLIPLVLQTANKRRDSIAIFGNDYNTEDGTCIRDYIHVNDLAEAHLLLLKYLENGGKERCFNLGTGTGYSVQQVINTAKQVTGKSINTIIEPRREGDPEILIADGAKAEQLLGWKPKHSDLTTIITHAWQWEQHIENTRS